MIERKLRFALFGKEFQDNKLVAIRNILTFLSSSNTQVAIDRPFHHYLADTLHLDVAAHQLFDGDDFEADFAVSVGGDGTFLQAASRVGAKGIPIIGINTGRLGFLADVLPSEIESAFGEMMELCIELIRQFYTLPRRFRISDRDGESRFTGYSAAGLRPVHQIGAAGEDLGYRIPLFDVRVHARRRNAYSAAAQNELTLELFRLGFFDPARRNEALAAVTLLDFEGKEEILRRLTEETGSACERTSL